MPRTARATSGGYCYHVLNRGNRRAEVFHADEDYDAFGGLLADTARGTPCGGKVWVQPTAARLEYTLRPRGRRPPAEPTSLALFDRPG